MRLSFFICKKLLKHYLYKTVWSGKFWEQKRAEKSDGKECLLPSKIKKLKNRYNARNKGKINTQPTVRLGIFID